MGVPVRTALLLVALVLPACGTPETGPFTRVRFWAMGSEAAAVEALLPAFEERFPGIHVDVQQVPWSVAHEKLLTAYVGEALPDVFQLGNTWIAEFAAIGAIGDLAARFAHRGTSDDFFPGILDSNQVQGRLYGIPWYVDTRVLFYRADLLKRAGFAGPPQTWAQWTAMMTRLTAQAPAERHAVRLAYDEWQFPVILALQRGSTLLRQDGRYGDFRSPAFRDAFALFLEVFRRGWAPPVGATQIGNPVLEFAQGRFLFFVSGPWMIGELGRRLPPDFGARWAAAPMPSSNSDYPGSSLAGGSSLAISTRSHGHDAAWKLIEFLTEPAQQVAFYRLTGDLPPRRSAWDDPVLVNTGHAQAFRAQLERTLAVPKVPEWERIAARIGHYAELAVRGILTEEDALLRLDRDVDGILEKRRWLLDRPAR